MKPILAVFLSSVLFAQNPGGLPSYSPGGPFGVQAPFVSTQNAGTDVICALHADSITGLTCNNQVTDGTTETAFTSSVTIPAGTLSNRTIFFYLGFGMNGGGSASTATMKVKLNGTAIYSSFANPFNGTTGTYRTEALIGAITAAGAASTTTPVWCSFHANGSISPNFGGANAIGTSGSLYVPINTTIDQVLTISMTWNVANAGNVAYLYTIAPAK